MTNLMVGYEFPVKLPIHLTRAVKVNFIQVPRFSNKLRFM